MQCHEDFEVKEFVSLDEFVGSDTEPSCANAQGSASRIRWAVCTSIVPAMIFSATTQTSRLGFNLQQQIEEGNYVNDPGGRWVSCSDLESLTTKCLTWWTLWWQLGKHCASDAKHDCGRMWERKTFVFTVMTGKIRWTDVEVFGCWFEF